MTNEARGDDVDLLRLRAWIAGDRAEGEQLYDKYFDITYRFFRSKAPNATKDLTQATMEALTRNGQKFEGSGSFRSYVLGIAFNVLRHHFRSRGRQRLEFNGEEASCEDLGLGPFEVVAIKEDQRLLVKALRRIPLHHQIVLELTYWEEMNSREVGVVLDVPASTIRDRLARGRDLLRQQLMLLHAKEDRVESTLIGLQTWAAELRGKFGESPALRG